VGERTPKPEAEHVFNDDLLIHRGDSEFARKRFPRIMHVLDNQSLRAEFTKYERAANEARDHVRLRGLIGVAASTLALVALATRPLWPQSAWTRWPAAIIELTGMLAAFVAIGGLWSGTWKRRWLSSRLMTERLRQWHFQLIVRRGSEIEASCKGGDAIIAFQDKREQWMIHFLKEHEGHLDSQLESAVDDPLEKIAWLHEHPSPYNSNSDVLRDVYDAYELLRFEHQYGYAVYKLETTTSKPFWQFLQWPPKVQRAVLSGVSSSCFIAALLLATLLVCADVFGSSEQLETYLRTAAIVVAIIGAALRTIETGLGLDGEIERYREYREKISRLHDRFKNTSDYQQRLRLMEELEYASAEEMQDFLRTHHKTRFVLA
jgi:hypothetical protein